MDNVASRWSSTIGEVQTLMNRAIKLTSEDILCGYDLRLPCTRGGSAFDVGTVTCELGVMNIASDGVRQPP